MGIQNFFNYVESALKWPTGFYDKRNITNDQKAYRRHEDVSGSFLKERYLEMLDVYWKCTDEVGVNRIAGSDEKEGKDEKVKLDFDFESTRTSGGEQTHDYTRNITHEVLVETTNEIDGSTEEVEKSVESIASYGNDNQNNKTLNPINDLAAHNTVEIDGGTGIEKAHVGCKQPTNEREENTVVGICVDLSSFCYGTIVEVVKSKRAHLTYRRSPSPVPPGILETQENRRRDAFDSLHKRRCDSDGTAFSDMTTQTENIVPGRTPTSRRRSQSLADSEEEGRPSKKKLKKTADDGMLKDTITDTILDDYLIEECARSCFDKLFDVIGTDQIVGAHYFCLHFDEHTTSCKWYEQYTRRTQAQIIVSKESRKRIFMETIKLVQVRLQFETKTHLLTLLDDWEEETVEDEKVRRLRIGEVICRDIVLQKMQLSGCERFGKLRRQKFLFGEGEWKCFYTMRDTVTEKNEMEAKSYGCVEENDITHYRWYVFGNDSDIGLGVLLHSSDLVEIIYVNSKKKTLSMPKERIMDENLHAYRALHFMALCLLGNDYVPRLVNASPSNINALGAEVDRILTSKEDRCRTYVNQLADLFRDRYYEPDASAEEESPPCRLNLSRAFSYVSVRLLMSTYKCASTTGVEEYYQIRETEETMDTTEGCCKKRMAGEVTHDRDEFSTECFTAFATCCLWYLAYTLFYKNTSVQDRREFQTKSDENRPLCVPGLPMRTPFTYGDRRLHELVRFQSSILKIRQAIKKESTSSLIDVFEKIIVEIFEK